VALTFAESLVDYRRTINLLDQADTSSDLSRLRSFLDWWTKVSTPVNLAMHLSKGSALEYQPFEWATYLNAKLLDLAQRKIRFLIIEAPVRHGKSLLATQWFPTWYLGHHPNHRILIGSYNHSTARNFGSFPRDTLIEHGAELFGVHVATAKAAAGSPLVSRIRHAQDNWELLRPHIGGVMSRGVGNPPTGSGFELIVIDDPIKSAAEAYSKTERDALWNWWLGSLRTRLNEGVNGSLPGVVVVIMSRWHEDDLVGRLLKAQENALQGDYPFDDRWEVLHLPALADPQLIDPDPLRRAPGQALCPQMWPEPKLLQLRDGPEGIGVGQLAFAALYQGSPRPESGGMFNPGTWRYADAAPAGIEWYLWWDLASTEKETAGSDPDYTAYALVGKTDDGFVFIGEAGRTRADPGGVERYVKGITQACIERWGVKKVRLPQDPGQAGVAQVGNYARKVLAGLDVNFQARTMDGDKVVRALPYAGQQNSSNVVLVRGPWNATFVEEHNLFPRGGHDDLVDAAAMGYRDAAGLLRRKTRML
jgi:predicted phage terminase large subunit-like protein